MAFQYCSYTLLKSPVLNTFLKSNLLASTIGGEVTTGWYRGFFVLDFIPGRSYQGEQALYHQLMTEPRPTLAGYGEVLVLQQNGCGLCSKWILSWRSMVYTTRCWTEELLNQPTAKITQFSQRTIATICSIGEHSWYQLSKNHRSRQSARSGKVRYRNHNDSMFSNLGILYEQYWTVYDCRVELCRDT